VSYPLVAISEFCKTGSGGTPSRKNPEYFEGNIPWVKSGELRESVVLSTGEHISNLAVEKSSAKIVPKGAILLAMYGATVGRMAMLGVDAATNQAVCNIIPDESVAFPSYVYYALSNKVPQFLNDAVGGAQPNISQGLIKDTKILLPPLNEQKRIAAILDKADSLRRKRQQAIQLADQFLRSVFLDLFGDSENKGWVLCTVEGLAENTKGSMRTGPFGSQLLHSEFTEDGISVLGIDNAVKNKFKWAKPRFISESKYESLKRFTVKPEDVLITIMGTCGRCAIVPKDCPTAINTKHLCCITLDQKKCLPSFLHSYFLQHPTARKYLAKNSKGAVMDGLNMGIIKNMPIFLPPMDIQLKYAEICNQVETLKNKLESSRSDSMDCFASLSQKAFAGEL